MTASKNQQTENTKRLTIIRPNQTNENTKRLTIIRQNQYNNEKMDNKEFDICPHCHSKSLVTLRYGRFQKIGAVFCRKCHKDKDYKSDSEDESSDDTEDWSEDEWKKIYYGEESVEAYKNRM